MPLTCSRCGAELPSYSPVETVCKRCGARNAHPEATIPISQRAVETMQSGRHSGGSLSGSKKYALVVLNGEEPGRIIPLDKSRVTLGRAGCDVVLNDPELSRQHALIAIEGLTARLEDLGSTNGTFMGEERIERVELIDRSEFRIGSHELVFVMTDRVEP